MKSTLMLIIAILFTLLVIVPAVSAVAMNAQDPANGDRPDVIVEQGKGKDANLIKVTHIHYAKSADKARPSKTVTCYKLAKWKWTALPIQYEVQDTVNPPALYDAIKDATNTWDKATSAGLFVDSPDKTSGKTWGGLTDGVNLVTYGDYPSDGVIAVTVTWYSLRTKIAVESDILFDNADFTWGDGAQNPTVMDLQNIATHEIGHTLGLSDIYDGSCSSVTMYGYSREGDVGKRSLEMPDITGLTLIYGP